jgi:hypothetical protein
MHRRRVFGVFAAAVATILQRQQGAADGRATTVVQRQDCCQATVMSPAIPVADTCPTEEIFVALTSGADACIPGQVQVRTGIDGGGGDFLVYQDRACCWQLITAITRRHD